jgi:hypothetical protein
MTTFKISFTLCKFIPGEKALLPPEQEAGRVPLPVCMLWKTAILTPAGIKPRFLDCPTHGLVTIPTMLSCLLTVTYKIHDQLIFGVYSVTV